MVLFTRRTSDPHTTTTKHQRPRSHTSATPSAHAINPQYPPTPARPSTSHRSNVASPTFKHPTQPPRDPLPPLPPIPSSQQPGKMNLEPHSRSATPASAFRVGPRIEVDHANDASGEPIVQDFAVPESYRPAGYREPESEMSEEDEYDEDENVPPPINSRRGMHVPSRTSSSTPRKSESAPRKLQRKIREAREKSKPVTSGSSSVTTPDSRELRSSTGSIVSEDTSASSIYNPPTTTNLPPLQAQGPLEEADDHLTPLSEDDPGSFDLLQPSTDASVQTYSLETRSEEIFSRAHLLAIFASPPLLLRFSSFLTTFRPSSVSLLVYYLDALKALRAINYANAIAEALAPISGVGGEYDFSQQPARPTINVALEEKARMAFDALVKEDLPAFVTHVWIQTVSLSVQRRITGTLAPHLREASEGLAEVFCLTDPSRRDNPIVFASEEFHRTTQYGVNYAIGRNCRFLQGPRTNPHSVARIRAAMEAGKEHSETFLNYRRDGSPFLNLLMIAPLFDSRGALRYFIGAQVDISGLAKDCSDLEGLQEMLEKEADEQSENFGAGHERDEGKKDEFQELAEMLNTSELATVRRFGGKMHREPLSYDGDDAVSIASNRPRLLLKDPTEEMVRSVRVSGKMNGRLEGIYSHYLLIRPYPSLRILFCSPSLRVPGMLQSPFLSRVGGSARVREELRTALAEGRGVTAKIRWISSLRSNHSTTASVSSAGGFDVGAHGNGGVNGAGGKEPHPASPAAAAAANQGAEEGRARWIHCTPLLGANGAVGVWMVVLVDDERSNPTRRFRPAPPVPAARGERLEEYQRRYGGGGGGGVRPKHVELLPEGGERTGSLTLGRRMSVGNGLDRGRDRAGSLAASEGESFAF
ncbi:hypothetical protein K402DRAFT_395896 [Aulographum hederae CBS 113979]|uniref:PAC domain-containing protein n=1 Tax=Aulographum hederae CBS 113979 TaxID=1176131 RepID=A0A6G1GTH9_9PEZI|nr:hypothetical protein K402DRAFT_395896 [Aulographum hederae CBS 113979]